MAHVSDTSADITLDAHVGDESTAPPSHLNPVAIVEGSSPQISTETATLLRGRLRAAAALLFLAFGSFFAWRLFRGRIGQSFDFYFHLTVTLVLGSSFFLLCRRCVISLTKLRGYELAIFGLPVAYFVHQQYWVSKIMADQGRTSDQLSPWVGTVLIYAMFIPNTWRRASVFIGIMCIAPVALSAYLWFEYPPYAAAMTDYGSYLMQLVIIMGVTFLAGTYGTHVINTLREEAFEAKQLGQYRLLNLIGAGGMGEVYLAEHQMMKRPVAIKLIRPGKAADPQALARFEREVRATAKLSHWNTIEIFDYGRTDDGTFYYVMEYLPGMSLGELVDKHGPLPPARAIHLLAQTCDALSEAHGRGLIHRDHQAGQYLFGLSRRRTTTWPSCSISGWPSRFRPGCRLRCTSRRKGRSPARRCIMSPEQALGDSEPDERSDIYSLGAVAYYLLTGSPPFEGDKPMRVILAHAHEPVVPPSTLAVGHSGRPRSGGAALPGQGPGRPVPDRRGACARRCRSAWRPAVGPAPTPPVGGKRTARPTVQAEALASAAF